MSSSSTRSAPQPSSFSRDGRLVFVVRVQVAARRHVHGAHGSRGVVHVQRGLHELSPVGSPWPGVMILPVLVGSHVAQRPLEVKVGHVDAVPVAHRLQRRHAARRHGARRLGRQPLPSGRRADHERGSGRQGHRRHRGRRGRRNRRPRTRPPPRPRRPFVGAPRVRASLPQRRRREGATRNAHIVVVLHQLQAVLASAAERSTTPRRRAMTSDTQKSCRPRRHRRRRPRTAPAESSAVERRTRSASRGTSRAARQRRGAQTRRSSPHVPHVLQHE